MTHCADLALLLHDPASGKGLVDTTALPRGLAGAAVLDLVLGGHARLDGEGRRARVVLTGDVPTDPVLRAATGRLTRPLAAKAAIEKLAKVVRESVLADLVAVGVLREQEDKALGLFPVRRWPAVDTTRRDALLARLHAVLVEDADPSAEDAALVSLVRAVSAEARLLDGASRRELQRRSKEIAEGEWAGDAVRKAIQGVQVVIMGAVAAGAAASGTS